MARYIVSTKRELRGEVPSAADVAAAAPRVTVLNNQNPDMITIDADAGAADALRSQFAATHFVEPEIMRGLD